MQRSDMTTLTREVPYSEIPKPWRQGLKKTRVVRVTLEDVPVQDTDMISYRAKSLEALRNVAGIWADRTDEEIDAWQNDLRAARKRRFDSLFAEE